MNDWAVIGLAVAALLVFFVILGLVFFFIAGHIEKSLPPHIAAVNSLNDQRAAEIQKDIEVLKSHRETSGFDFTQFEVGPDDSLSDLRDKHDVTLILIRKVIEESHTLNPQLLEIKKAVEILSSGSNEVFDIYNRKVSSYNTFIRFIFTRPFAYLAKKGTYPNIH